MTQVAVTPGAALPAPWGGESNFISVANYSYPAFSGSRTLTQQVDAAGKVKTEYRDGLGRLVFVDHGVLGGGADGAAAGYSYNGRDQLRTASEQNVLGNRTRSFQYDSLGRLTSTVQPESGTSSYTYFADGQLKRKTDAAGLWVEMSYDGAHRLSRKTMSTGEAIDYCYDGKVYTGSGCGDLSGRSTDFYDYPKGHLTGVGTAGGWTNHLRVDELGRTLKVEQKASDLAAKTLEYEYATNGFVKKMKYPSGRELTFTQTRAWRTRTAVGPGNLIYASDLVYGGDGAMLSGKMNGTGASRLEERRTYNALGQMLTQSVYRGEELAANLRWRITNEYGTSGNNGNLNKQWTETGEATYGVRYVYDGANRIRGAAENAPGEASLLNGDCTAVGGTWCVKYRMDGFGNAWTENKSLLAGGLIPAASTAFDGSTNRLVGVGYDDNGNQRQWLTNNNKSRAEYDSEGHLRKAGITTAAGGTAWDAAQMLTEMTYNGMGQRVKTTVTQGAAVTTVHYVYGLDGEVAAEWESAPGGGAARQFFVADQLGSTRIRFDGNGDVIQRVDYEPYGVEVQRAGVSGYTGSNEAREKYTGKERVPEVAADYFNARWLGMGLGRFSSPDPLLNSGRPWDARSWNRYAYTLGEPMALVDPEGLYEYGTCDGTQEQCKQARADFERALDNAAKAASSLKDKNAANAIKDSLKAIGKADQKNGVVVNFDFSGNAGGTKATGQSVVVAGEDGRLSRVNQVGITINPLLVQALAKNQNLQLEATFAQLVAHEVFHIADARVDASEPKSFEEYFRREYPAYRIGSFVNEGLNQNAPFDLWNVSWAKASDKQVLRDKAIRKIINDFGRHFPGAPR